MLRKSSLGVASIFGVFLGILQACHSPQADPYSPLVQHLTAADWQAADGETLHLLLTLSDRLDQNWLQQSDVETLDCDALVHIDQLWNDHSQGQFGFNQQRLIWMNIGGKVGQYEPTIAAQFGDRVGWRTQGQWLTYDRLNFSTLAPPGHLPASTGNGVSGAIWGGVATLSDRLQYCRHQVAITAARAEYYGECDRQPQQAHCQLKTAAERWGKTPDWGNTGIPSLFHQLEQALATQQWIMADKITSTLLDRYRQANHAEFDDSDHHALIPCYLLTAVDQLWTQYSQDHFGLTAQDTVLNDLIQASSSSTLPSVAAFREALGWPEHIASGSDPQYNLAFDQIAPTQIPKGYYPYNMGYSYSTYGSGYANGWRFDLNPVCGFFSRPDI